MVRESEIKFHISAQELDYYLAWLHNEPRFGLVDERVEIDFVPDTRIYDFRKVGLILRARCVKRPPQDNDVLITLKSQRSPTSDIQDSDEIEFLVGGRNASVVYSQICSVINDQTSVPIKAADLSYETFAEWVDYFVHGLGLTSVRSFVEKKRTVFRNSQGDEICLDEFPEPVGRFLEIESHSPREVYDAAELLGIDWAKADPRTYGKIVAEKMSTPPWNHPRICLSPQSKAEFTHALASIDCTDGLAEWHTFGQVKAARSNRWLSGWCH